MRIARLVPVAEGLADIFYGDQLLGCWRIRLKNVDRGTKRTSLGSRRKRVFEATLVNGSELASSKITPVLEFLERHGIQIDNLPQPRT